MKHLSVLFFVGILISCSQTTNNEKDRSSFKAKGHSLNVQKDPLYELIITQESSHEYGYQILKDGELMIDQKNIPAIQGNKAFSSRLDAQTVAHFALDKIKNGVFPPTISVAELDSLGVS
jgi:hypothetical protein